MSDHVTQTEHRTTTVRRSPRRDHLEVTREAGLGRVSAWSVAAGVVCAYGTFAVVGGIVGSIAVALDAETDFRSDDWTSSGAVASLITAVVLLVAYLFGGYVAGRMARRAGALHGAVVAGASLLVGGVAGTIVGVLADDAGLRANLRSIGVPTTADQVTNVGLVGALVSIAAMVVGAIAGGALGERWHTKLVRRVADPSVGPAADARRAAEQELDLRAERIDRDELVRREAAEHVDTRP